MDANNLIQTPEENTSSWKKIVAVLAIVLVLGGGAYYYYSAGQSSELKGSVTRSSVDFSATSNAVTATQTVDPLPTAERIINQATESQVGTTVDNKAAVIENATRPTTIVPTDTTTPTTPVAVDTRACTMLEIQIKSALAKRDMAQAKIDGAPLIREWAGKNCGTLPTDIKASWDAVLAYKEPVVATVSKCDQLLASFRTMLFGSTDKNAMRIAGTPMVAELTTNKCTIPRDLQAKWDEVKNYYATTPPTAAQCKTATDALMAKIKAGDLAGAEALKPRVENLGCTIPADVQAALDNLINNIKNPLVTPVDICSENVTKLTALVAAKDKVGAESLYNKMTRAATKPCTIPAGLEASYQTLLKADADVIVTRECGVLLTTLNTAITAKDKTQARVAYNAAKAKCTIPPATDKAYWDLEGATVVVAVDPCVTKAASFQSLLDLGAQVSKTRLESAYTSLKTDCAGSVTAAMENTYAQLMAAGEVVTEVTDEPVTEPVVDDQEAICAQKIGKFDNAVNQGIISLADVLYDQIAGKCMISQDSMDLYNALKSGGNSGDGGYVYNGGSGSSDSSAGLGGGNVSTGSGTGGSALITATEGSGTGVVSAG
ncbi:MAG: hypothetical protein WCT36_00995, partial [Candidatus Gracilibacteria bacterium]